MRVTTEKIDLKSAILFTDVEFDLIKGLSKDTWKMLNRCNYQNMNYIYIYEDTTRSHTVLFEIYKFDDYFVIDDINSYHTLYIFHDMTDMFEFLRDY